jgi:hypothetical protein
VCPPSSWAGWTTGSWSGSELGWTSWTACTATATASSVYTSTISGSVITGTSYGYRVAEATGSSTTTASAGAGVPAKAMITGAAGMVAAAVGGVVMVL